MAKPSDETEPEKPAQAVPATTRDSPKDPVPPPGPRVDDENEDPGDKRTTRQE